MLKLQKKDVKELVKRGLVEKFNSEISEKISSTNLEILGIGRSTIHNKDINVILLKSTDNNQLYAIYDDVENIVRFSKKEDE